MPKELELPVDGKPQARFTVRQEDFGYVLLGQGQAIPVHSAALPVVEACDGYVTLAEIAERYGQTALNLIGDLWVSGLLTIT